MTNSEHAEADLLDQLRQVNGQDDELEQHLELTDIVAEVDVADALEQARSVGHPEIEDER